MWRWLLACAPDPTLAITAPTADAVVCGEPLVVDVAVTDFALIPMDDPVTPGAGHIDLTLNGQPVMMGHEPPFDLFGMADGRALLRAELVGSDHAPLDPPVTDEVQITIDHTRCEDPS